MIRYSCRIKLNDFIETSFEEDIVETMRLVSEQTNSNIFLKLWYPPGSIDQTKVLSFVKRYELTLEKIGCNIHAGSHEHWTQQSWFDIRSRLDVDNNPYRYYYLYDKPEDIISGIFMFKSMVEKTIHSAAQPKQPTVHQKPQQGKYTVSYRKVPYDDKKSNRSKDGEN